MELKIKKETAKKLYGITPEWFQELLTETFGADCFKKKDWNDIKTFEDACEVLSIDPDSVYHEDDKSDEIAYKKLKVIVRAINQGWVPDWDNGSQYKWWPWFNLSSGFGFSYSSYSYDGTFTYVGSRLCFESKEKCVYAAKQFKDLYQDYFLFSE